MTTMAKKKHSITSSSVSCLRPFAQWSRVLAMALNMPSACKPPMTDMRQNSSTKTCQLI